MKRGLFILIALLAMTATWANEKDMYVVLSPDGTTLTFFYDTLRDTREGENWDYDGFDYRNDCWGGIMPCMAIWANPSITKAVFDASFADARPKSTGAVFSGCINLETIIGLDNLNTSEVTNMALMFYDCQKLLNIELENFDTSKVIDMSWMFRECQSLNSLDISNFNITLVEKMAQMFTDCNSLLDLYIPTTMELLDENACEGIGSEDMPCHLHAPEGVDFGITDTNGLFTWKSGVFRLSQKNAFFAVADPFVAGGKTQVAVFLDNNEDDVDGVQFDLILPEGFELAKNGSTWDCELSNRFTGQVNVANKGKGRYRFIIFSMNDDTVALNSGELISIGIQASDTVLADAHPAKLEGVILSTVSELSLHLPDAPFTLNILPQARGDVNGDGCTNVTDVMMTVDHILGCTLSQFRINNADCNSDGQVDVTDVTIIIHTILSGKNCAPDKALSLTATVEGQPSDGGFDISASGMTGIRAVQMVIALPKNATLSDISLLGNASRTHKVETSSIGNGRFLVVAYSLKGEELDQKDALMHIDLAGTAESAQISDIQIADFGPITAVINSTAVTKVSSVIPETNDKFRNNHKFGLGGQSIGKHYKGLILSYGDKRMVK